MPKLAIAPWDVIESHSRGGAWRRTRRPHASTSHDAIARHNGKSATPQRLTGGQIRRLAQHRSRPADHGPIDHVPVHHGHPARICTEDPARPADLVSARAEDLGNHLHLRRVDQELGTEPQLACVLGVRP